MTGAQNLGQVRRLGQYFLITVFIGNFLATTAFLHPPTKLISTNFQLPNAACQSIRCRISHREAKYSFLSLQCSGLSHLESLTVADLRAQLQKYGEKPPSKLKKAELISLLAPYIGDDDPRSAQPNSASAGNLFSGPLNAADLNSMTVQQLKDELKARGLRVGGTKPELLQRLTETLASADSSPPPAAQAGHSPTPGDAETAVRDRSDDSAYSGSAQSGERSEDSEGAGPGGDIMDEEETTQVFVRGLSFRARPQELVDFFQTCGEVVRIEGMFFNGRASGRAWVTFEEPQAAVKALELHKADLLGRFVEVYPPWSRPARQALRQVTDAARPDPRPSNAGPPEDAAGYNTALEGVCPTVFLGRVPLSATEEEVQEVMGGFGPIAQLRMGRDRDTGAFRGFAHVVYEDPADAASAVRAAVSPGLELGGRQVRADFAPDRARDPSRVRR